MRTRVGTFAPLSALRSASLPRERRGTFATALVFVEWLRRTKQGLWQMLPLAETHLEPGSSSARVPSPYKGYGVGIDPSYLAKPWSGRTPTEKQRAAFAEAHADWLPDYALFCALRDRFGTDDWTAWNRDIRVRRPAALRRWKRELAAEIQRHADDQWRAHTAFADLRRAARGINLAGDVSFYLPLQSPLVWANRRAFDVRADGTLPRVSGVIDGPRSHYGRQMWGHPLYRWSLFGRPAAMRVWRLRLRHAAELYDMVRLDFSAGFFQYGALVPGNADADRLRPGPGAAVLRELLAYCHALGLHAYAEDAGGRMHELHQTLRAFHVPGIRILRFAYNEQLGEVVPYYADTASYPRRTVALTSTHDTDTLFGYVRKLTSAERRVLAKAVGVRASDDPRILARRLREAVLRSSAAFVLVPIQDWLLTDDRINVPGTERPVGDPNWRYRLTVPIERLPTHLF